MKCPHCDQPIDITKTVLQRMGNVKEFHELARCSNCFNNILVNVTVELIKQ